MTTGLSLPKTVRGIDLEELIESILHVIGKQASKIISLFIFRDDSDELWDRPPVKIDDENITLVCKALIANPIRLASRMLNELKFQMKDKGIIFEEFARTSLIQKNKLGNTKIYPKSYPFNDGKKRDIDLVVAQKC